MKTFLFFFFFRDYQKFGRKIAKLQINILCRTFFSLKKKRECAGNQAENQGGAGNLSGSQGGARPKKFGKHWIRKSK